MFKTIAIVVAVIILVVVLAVLLLALRKPDTFEVKRQIRIQAAPEKIFPLINDYHQWAQWSPYEKKDPAMKREFTGAASGKGARYAWDSANGGVGTGDMEITDSVPSSTVKINLNFSKPFEGHNKVVFSLQPQAGGTLVTWAMSGPAPLLSKVMQVFFNMDKMVGNDFDAGLTQLKAAAEKTS